ncbi:hypothetical protein BH11PLA2_BH11PLA2_25320 [soil metagenome]
MFRTCFAAAVALMLGSIANAAEIKGKVAKVDAEGNKLTITVDGKDTTYTVAKDASFTTVSTSPAKKPKKPPVEKVETIEKGLAGISAGANVTVLAEKETISSVKVTAGSTDAPKKKKKAKAAK